MRLSLLLLFACTLLFASKAQGADDTPSQLVLELSDGSRIIGTPEGGVLKMKTDYADVEIPVAKLRLIEFDGGDPDHTAHASLRNGDALHGRLALKEVVMKTLFGEAKIPLALVRRLRVVSGGWGLPEGLVLHYIFSADQGERVADASGSGNDGTVRNATFSDRERPAGAMVFNGDHAAITLGNPAALQLQDMTIMAWIKCGGGGGVRGSGMVFCYGQGGYGLGFDNDHNLALTQVGTIQVVSKLRIEDGDWHHVAVTKQGTTVVFYLDGTAYQSRKLEVNFEFTTDAAVGARGDTLDNSFLGQIGEVEVFGRALPGDEVKGVYESQK